MPLLFPPRWYGCAEWKWFQKDQLTTTGFQSDDLLRRSLVIIIVTWSPLCNHVLKLASFAGSPHMWMKNQKARGEPSKFYHVRNAIGRENLITCGWTNESSMLYGQIATVIQLRWLLCIVRKPVHSKITLTSLLTWQTDCCSPQRMAFKALLNAKAALS